MNLTDKQRLQFRRMNYAFWEYQPLDGTPTETPKYFNRPNQTNSLDHVWTISPNKVNELLATVSLDDVYIPVDTAHFLDRTTVGHQLSVHLPAGQADPHPHPHREHDQLQRPERRSLSVALRRTDLRPFRQLHLGQGQPHVQVRHVMYEKSGENDNDEINVSAPARPAPTTRTASSLSPIPVRAQPTSAATPSANAALGLFDTYSELGQRAYTIFRGSMYEAVRAGFLEGQPEAARRLRRSLHRDRSLPRPVGQHGRLRSRALRSRARP